MIGTYALALLNVVFWGFFTLKGVEILERVSAQRVPGYPTAEQIAYYLGLPAIVFVGAVVATFLRVRGPVRHSIWPVIVLIGLLLVAFPYLLSYGGGV